MTRYELALALALTLTTTSAHALDKVTFVTDWLPGGNNAFPYIAKKEGLFAKEGLDVTITTGRGSYDVITKMATGTAEFGAASISALFTAMVEQQVPVKAVLSVYSKQPDAIFFASGSPINKVADLKGKTVATATFSSSNVLWPVVARANDLDPNTVKLLKVDPATLGGLLASGQVDATINWMTVAPRTAGVLKTAGKKLAMLPWSDIGLDGYGLSVFATDNVIKNRPDIVTRLNRAYLEAIKISIADCARAADDLHSLVPESDLAVVEQECEATNPLIKNEISDKAGIGSLDPNLLKAGWAWVAKAQGYEAGHFDPESQVDRKFIP
jgi:NitT/TauT family transport system substrate-binding protein